jgi:50S ribosomal subunit-associated GTPase HflX
VVTKADLPGAEEVCRRLAEETGRATLLISAVTGLGLNKLMGAIALALAEQKERLKDKG